MTAACNSRWALLPGLEHAQQIAAHESARTTKLSDHTRGQVSVDEIERIDIQAFSKDVGEKQDARAYIVAIRAWANEWRDYQLRPCHFDVSCNGFAVAAEIFAAVHMRSNRNRIALGSWLLALGCNRGIELSLLEQEAHPRLLLLKRRNHASEASNQILIVCPACALDSFALINALRGGPR